MIYPQYANYQQFQPNIPQPNFQQPQFQQPQSLNVQPAIQNGGFFSVRNEQEARNYPVAPGISLMFRDENSPYVYTKTMGFSQLDRPQFDKYRLVKEDVETETQPEQTQNPSYLVEEDLNPIFDKLKDFKSKIEDTDNNLNELNEKFENLISEFKNLDRVSVKQVSTKTSKVKEDK